MSTIFWDDRSPSTVGATRVPPVLVWNPAPNSKAFVRLLGPYRGVWLHWLGRSVPCRGEGCPHCGQGVSIFWQGYSPALLWSGSWKPIVCPITYDVACTLQGRDLAGLVVEISRHGRRRNSPIVCSVIESANRVKEPPPPPFDVEPILRRMWRLREAQAQQGGSDRGGDDVPPPTLLPFARPAGELPPAAEGGGA